MCSYKTLPMIGTGCGMSTDHLARSGIIGNGARPICGIPASLATLDTAMLGGVVDEPMMMSALDSVTKRRALVVALVGPPPASGAGAVKVGRRATLAASPSLPGHTLTASSTTARLVRSG